MKLHRERPRLLIPSSSLRPSWALAPAQHEQTRMYICHGCPQNPHLASPTIAHHRPSTPAAHAQAGMPREALSGEGKPAEMRRVCNNWRGNSHYSSMPCMMHAATSHASEIAVARRARPHYPVYCGRTSQCPSTTCKCVCVCMCACVYVGKRGWVGLPIASDPLNSALDRARRAACSWNMPSVRARGPQPASRSASTSEHSCLHGATIAALLSVLLLLDICHDPEDMWMVVGLDPTTRTTSVGQSSVRACATLQTFDVFRWSIIPGSQSHWHRLRHSATHCHCLPLPLTAAVRRHVPRTDLAILLSLHSHNAAGSG